MNNLEAFPTCAIMKQIFNTHIYMLVSVIITQTSGIWQSYIDNELGRCLHGIRDTSLLHYVSHNQMKCVRHYDVISKEPTDFTSNTTRQTWNTTISAPTGIITFTHNVPYMFRAGVQLLTRQTIGFNFTFTKFEMGYSGARCPYEKLTVEEVSSCEDSTITQYCGRRRPWVHVSLVADVYLHLDSFGNYPTYVKLSYQPVNRLEFSAYKNDIFPVQVYREGLNITFTHGNSQMFAQFIETNTDHLSNMMIKAYIRYTIQALIKTEQSHLVTVMIYEGPIFEEGFLLYHNTYNESEASFTSVGPSISISITLDIRWSVQLDMHFAMQKRNVIDKMVTLETGKSTTVSSENSCLQKRGVSYCTIQLVAPVGHYPNISVSLFEYNGPDTHLCLYGSLSIYNTSPSIKGSEILIICSQESDTLGWPVIGSQKSMQVVVLSYDKLVKMELKARVTKCRGQLPNCLKGGDVSRTKRKRIVQGCAYIFRYPTGRAIQPNMTCNIYMLMMDKIMLNIVRTITTVNAFQGGWVGYCRETIETSPSASYKFGLLDSTKSERRFSQVFRGFRMRAFLQSNCTLSRLAFRIHIREFCDVSEFAHLTKKVSWKPQVFDFASSCSDIIIPAIQATFLHMSPTFHTPIPHVLPPDTRFLYNLDKILTTVCLEQRENCLIKVHFWKNESCPLNCVKDILRVRQGLSTVYYIGEQLNNLLLTYPERGIKGMGIELTRFVSKETKCQDAIQNCVIFYSARQTVSARVQWFMSGQNKLRAESDFSFSRNDLSYKVHPFQTDSWESARNVCNATDRNLLTLDSTDKLTDLHDIYTLTRLRRQEGPQPALIFLGIEPTRAKVSLIYYTYLIYLIVNVFR